MDVTEQVGIVMAAQELLPAEPSDLTGLLHDPRTRTALLRLNSQGSNNPLLQYLCDRLDADRISYWSRETQRLILDGVKPLVAGTSVYPTYKPGYWNPPPILFTRGNTAPDQTGSLAIIGSRDTDAMTLKETRHLAAELTDHGLVVISGLAAGIDTSAHLGALDANGVTIAVLGTGIDNVYPLQNEMLAYDIAQRGAVISQFAPNAPRTPTSFLRRNCVIAGLADASLVMAADERSGSRHEIEQAAAYGRPVLFWARTLAGETWAQDFVASDLGVFVNSSSDAIAILQSTHAN